MCVAKEKNQTKSTKINQKQTTNNKQQTTNNKQTTNKQQTNIKAGYVSQIHPSTDQDNVQSYGSSQLHEMLIQALAGMGQVWSEDWQQYDGRDHGQVEWTCIQTSCASSSVQFRSD